MPMMTSGDFRRNLIECAAKWSLTLGEPYPESTYSYVVRATRADGSATVLKLTRDDATREAEALRAFDGRGAVRLLEHDANALLLERAEPGDTLTREADDTRAMTIAARVMRTLHREPSSIFPTVATWRRDLQNEPHALAIFDELLASATRNVLLHGDLHQFNILDAGDRWLAIDPKGLAGEPECEIAPLVLNLYSDPHRRIRQLCNEASLDLDRAYRWTYVRAVLAVVWAREDDGAAPPHFVQCAAELR